MLHYLCNTTCCGYLHCTLYTDYLFLFFFLHNCVHLFVCLTYSSLCCNRSKSIDSINALYTFQYLVISSSLFSCKFIILFMRSLGGLSARWSYIYIHTYTLSYIHTYIYTYIHTHFHTYTYTHIHIYIHTYIHTYIHMYIHTYKRTYTNNK